jgi:flagellar motor switch protein FliN
MSPANPAGQNLRVQEYMKAWGASISHIVQDVAGMPQAVAELSPEATQALLSLPGGERISVQFEATQHLAGAHAFVLSKKDMVRLAQILLGEPEDENAEMKDDHRDAAGELFRQFAGVAASALKELGEVSFKWVGMAPLPGEPAFQAGMQWTCPGKTPLKMVAQIDAALLTALTATPDAPAHQLMNAPAPGLPAPAGSKAHASTVRDPKLDLLMDVELEVALQFGERQMPLREILDLSAGSVVELDQNVQDPVALLVGEKVVARGQVVVVDGNYGLRVMEIISPMERIESLRS